MKFDNETETLFSFAVVPGMSEEMNLTLMIGLGRAVYRKSICASTISHRRDQPTKLRALVRTKKGIDFPDSSVSWTSASMRTTTADNCTSLVRSAPNKSYHENTPCHWHAFQHLHPGQMQRCGMAELGGPQHRFSAGHIGHTLHVN